MHTDLRLEIFQAVQQGDFDVVNDLLTATPELITAKTTTKGSSLLHVAAERGHEKICKLLLEKGHETNPVDKEGNTPWQRAKSENIKSILSKSHQNFLCKKYFSSCNLEVSKNSLVNQVTQEICVMNDGEFRNLIQEHEKNCDVLKDIAFLHAMTICIPTRCENEEKKYDFHIKTIFLEKILMLPYYGDVLVIHENEQAYLQKDLLNDGYCPSRLKATEYKESKAFLASSADGIKYYPFLGKFPEEGDSPEIREAKKAFIAFNLIGGFADFFPQIKEEQLKNALMELDEYTQLMNHAGDIINNPRHPACLMLFYEMIKKYSINNKVTNINLRF